MTRTPAEKLADFVARYPQRVADCDRMLGRYIHLPATTLAVIRDDLLQIVFGVVPEPATRAEATEILDLEPQPSPTGAEDGQ